MLAITIAWPATQRQAVGSGVREDPEAAAGTERGVNREQLNLIPLQRRIRGPKLDHLPCAAGAGILINPYRPGCWGGINHHEVANVSPGIL